METVQTFYAWVILFAINHLEVYQLPGDKT